jgi:uncharacterized repeat protein (TIGR01451 family)
VLKRLAGAVAALAFAVVAAAAHAQSADLVVNQADSPDPGPAGGVFTYTIRVDNNGPDAAIAVTLSDTLPVGSTFVGVATTQGSCTQSAGTVSCTLGDLAFLANATVSLQLRLPTAGVWTNTVTASAATADPNSSNNAGLAASDRNESDICPYSVPDRLSFPMQGEWRNHLCSPAHLPCCILALRRERFVTTRSGNHTHRPRND